MTLFAQLSVKSVGHRQLFYAMAVLAAFFAASPTFAAMDLLNTPAMKSEKATTSMLTDVVNTGSRLVAVGERGHILFSEDKGMHWQQAEVPTSLTLTAVFFPSAEKGWAVGHDGVVLHSADGGKSWTRQLDAKGIIEANIALAKALVAAKEKALSRTVADEREKLETELEDLRSNLEEFQGALDQNSYYEPLMDVWFKNESEGFVVGAYGQICHTADGGKTWAALWDRIDNPERLHLNAIAQAANGSLFIAGETGTMYRSLDGGQHWEKQKFPYEGSTFGLVANPNDTYVITLSLDGKIVHTNDLGENWRLSKTNAAGTLAGATVCADGKVILVSSIGAILIGSGNTATFALQKVDNVLMGVADTLDGHAVVVGLRGIQRIPIGDKR